MGKRADDLARIKRATAALSEHFDSVHIFVTKTVKDGTASVSWGAGNWFARYGQVKEWTVKQEAQSAADQTAPDEDWRSSYDDEDDD